MTNKEVIEEAIKFCEFIDCDDVESRISRLEMYLKYGQLAMAQCVLKNCNKLFTYCELRDFVTTKEFILCGICPSCQKISD